MIYIYIYINNKMEEISVIETPFDVILNNKKKEFIYKWELLNLTQNSLLKI